MMLKNFRRTTTALALLFMSNIASAGIIDTDRDSFIDDTTGLEWLDFNITAPHSFNYVTANLGQGQEYDGWRLANIDEAIQLIKGNFPKNATRINESSDSLVVWGEDNTKSKFEDDFDAMGYTYNNSIARIVLAYFFDEQNSLARFAVSNSFTHPVDSIRVDYNQSTYEDKKDVAKWTSTLLVKGTSTATTTQVSEPASILVFTLGLMALGLRRFNKTKIS